MAFRPLQKMPTVGEYYSNLLRIRLNQPIIAKTEVVVTPIDLTLSEQINQRIESQKEYNRLLWDYYFIFKIT